MMFLNTLSGRFLVLTVVFVMLAEVFIFVPSVARFREDYLLLHLERSQIASLALLADEDLDADLQRELLDNAGVYNVVLFRDEVRQLMLSSPVPREISRTFDLRDAGALVLISDALRRITTAENELVRVIGLPVRGAGELIEITMETEQLRREMIDYGQRILMLSAVISLITATLLFLSVRMFLVRPIDRVVDAIKFYGESPEDNRRIIDPSAGIVELREAEEVLQAMQKQLTASLRQKERLAQLGGAVAKISHDLRNILTTAQLFADRLEHSEDPKVKKSAPKLLNSISRAVNLCETTLAFGKAEEPSPTLSRFELSQLVDDVFENENLREEAMNIALISEVPTEFSVRADPEQLFRVISNLVRNARQAIASKKQAGEIRITTSESEHFWKITVRDNGPGLPDKALDHLFQPFHGGVRAGGFGLGLAISSELVRGHGGSLELHETSNAGTCFLIRLPKGFVADVADSEAAEKLLKG